VGAKSHFLPTKIETNCAYKTPSRTTTSPFLRANNSNHSRSIRKRFDSRKKRARSHPYRRFSTSKNFSFSPTKREPKKNRKRALSSDSVSLTLNVLKYVVAFFGPFWRKPRVNMFLVPCLRPLLRALWLPMFVYVLFQVRFYGACGCENFFCVCCIVSKTQNSGSVKIKFCPPAT
jgi:hypothetical protein